MYSKKQAPCAVVVIPRGMDASAAGEPDMTAAEQRA